MDLLSIRQINGIDLVVLQGTRIVVPTSARKRVVRELHNAHFRLTKSIMTAQQLYYWPGMCSDIKSFIDACVPCQQARPSLARQKLLPPASPSDTIQPMWCVGIDLFAAAGNDWVAMVDRYSGYPWAAKLARTTTGHVLSHLETWLLCFHVGATLLLLFLCVTCVFKFKRGVTLDPDIISALANFPTPTDQTSVRSFLGLCNKLAFFLPDYQHHTVALRQLTGKG